MAIVNGYSTLARIKERLGAIDHSDEDNNLEEAVESASREIDGMCARHFYSVTDVLRAPAYGGWVLWVPDIVHGTITSLKVDTTDNGTFDTTWTEGTDFELEPYEGDLKSGVQFPASRLVAISEAWPVKGRRPRRVEISADFGWAATPHPIRQACLELAAFRFVNKDSPLGVAGYGDFGEIRVKELQSVAAMLAPFSRKGLGFA